MTFRAIPVLAVLALLTAPALAAPAKTVKAVKEAPITVESLMAQARTATAKGEIELALRLVQSAIVADPARPTTYVALGDIYAVSGQPDYARNFYDAALQIDPMDPGALKAIVALDKSKPSTTANATR